MRIGTGFDVHAFCEGSYLVLGGIEIPFKQGFTAHSDGDVALHALCDGLLGAAALGDIGKHFPPSDPDFKDADSRVLLRSVMELIGEAGWCVNNVDLSIICESPRVGPHVDLMRELIAADLDTDISCVSVKATTTEGLGFCGRDEGIAALAIVSLIPAPVS